MPKHMFLLHQTSSFNLITIRLRLKIMARKKNITQEHQINGRELIEAIDAIAYSQEIEREDLITILTDNIKDVLLRKNKEFKFAQLDINLSNDGVLDIRRVYHIVPKYSDTYEENCKEIIQDDIQELLNKYVVENNDEATKEKQNQYVQVDTKNNLVYEKIDFKFERKLFEDLRGITKGKISMTSKQNKFEKIRHQLDFFQARVFNIRKGNIYVNYEDVEFILPFSQLENSQQKPEIGDYIYVTYYQTEELSNSVRYYVSNKFSIMIPILFKKYVKAFKNSELEIKFVSKMHKNNGYKLFIKSSLSKEFIHNFLFKNDDIRYVRKLLKMKPEDKFVYITANSVEEFLVDYLYKTNIKKIIHNVDLNCYQIVVDTYETKSYLKREMKALSFYLNILFSDDPNNRIKIKVLTEKEETKQDESLKNRHVKTLMKTIGITDVVAGVLYDDGFETVDVVAFVDVSEFDNIKDELSKYDLTPEQIQQKARKHMLDNVHLYEKAIDSNLYELDLSMEEIEILIERNIKSKDDVADLDMFELQDMLSMPDDRAKQIILSARNIKTY